MALLKAVGFQDWVERWNIDSGAVFSDGFLLPDPVTGLWGHRNDPKLIYTQGRYPNTYGIAFTSTYSLGTPTGTIRLALPKVIPIDGTVIVGFGYKSPLEPGSSNATTLIEFHNINNSVINRLRVDDNGTLDFQLQPDSFKSPLVHDLNWHYIEVKIRVSNTSGYLELRIDGQVVYTRDNIDTSEQNNNANVNVSSIVFRAKAERVVGPSPIHIFSDIYVCDDTGPDNNDFLGDVVVQTLRPNANGSVSDLMGSDGNQVNNFALVNSINPTAENYVESAVVGERDLYNMENLAIPGDVLAVQSKISASKDGVGFGTMRSVLSNGSSESYGPSEPLSPGEPALKPATIFERDPDDLYWTEQSVNDLQVGVEVGDV